jgi:aminodeoxyfutalosine deaminase
MGAFFRNISKAELHLHLEGSIWPETLLEIDPALDSAEVHRRYQYEDFLGFIETFKWVLGFLRGPDEYALATRRLCERLAADNVRYAEIIFAGAGILKRGLDFAAVYDAIDREAQRSAVDVRWIVDATRHFPPAEAMEIARLAVERAGRVVAFGLGGIEADGPIEEFADVLAFARQQGLKLTPHAGETVGPESVRAAVELGADRIGHGIRAADDPKLLALLAERNVPLEICISSNIATGAVATLAVHPVRRIHDAGVPIILNTDDPAMFHTTLPQEYELAERHFGFSRGELKTLAGNAFEYAFDCAR